MSEFNPNVGNTVFRERERQLYSYLNFMYSYFKCFRYHSDPLLLSLYIYVRNASSASKIYSDFLLGSKLVL